MLMNMKAVTTRSSPLSFRGAVPKDLLRQYHTVNSKRSLVTTRAAAASMSMHRQHEIMRIHPPHPTTSFPLARQPSPMFTAVLPSASVRRRHLFIQTDTTPNPESLKFIPNGRLVLGHRTESADSANPYEEDASDVDTGNSDENSAHENTNGVHLNRKDHTLIAQSPLAKCIFSVDPLGIKSVYLGYDFLTVTKYAEAHWTHLQTPIFGAIMDFYATNEPVYRDVPVITDTTILDDDDEVVAMIKELLETRIRPAVQEDGGDIRYVGFAEETGIVTVQLAGSCVGCPSSSVTLKNGVENMLMHYIPEVTNVVSLEEEEEEEDGDGGHENTAGLSDNEDVVVEQSQHADDQKKMNTYKDKLAAAGIPFSD